jgi:hypothetical protein
MFQITRFSLVSTTLIFAGCMGSPPAPEFPDFDPEGSAAAALEQLDANKDGKLDAKEMEKSPGLAAAAAELDTSGDKALDAAEIAARVQSYADGAVARKMFTAQVWDNGVPIPGAEVKLVPEAYMLGAIAEGTGVSDAGGVVTVTVPGADPPGIGVGFYRVEISKKDASGKETIPAKYNTASTLGIEVPAFTKIRTSHTPTFNLKP